MKQKLTTKDMQMLAALKPEPTLQYSVNHENCPAGEDTRGRLSYRLSDDTRLLLAHCFNCGRSGVYTVKSRFWKMVETPKEILKEDYDQYDFWMKQYGEATPIEFNETEQWPSGYFASCWDEFCEAEKFGIRETDLHYLIPRGNVPSDITGFEVRTKGAKSYKRIVHPSYKEDSKLLIYNKDNSKVGVVCEDPISAMKASLAGFAGVALCGTTLSISDALKLSMLFDKVVIWLDNDAPVVESHANLARSRLSMYMDHVGLVHNLSDPKGYTLPFVRGVIQDMIKTYE